MIHKESELDDLLISFGLGALLASLIMGLVIIFVLM